MLILNKAQLSQALYDEWFPDLKQNGVLFSAKESVKSEEDRAKIESRYAVVKWFDGWDKNASIEVEARVVIDHYKCDRVIALSEVDVLRSARLRSYARRSLNSPIPETMVILRDKAKMREAAERAGLRQPRSLLVNSLESFEQAKTKLGFPFLVKPRLNGGSIGVHFLKNEDDCATFLSKSALAGLDEWHSFLGEEFVDGKMIHVDGVVVDGKVHFSIASEYFNLCIDAFSGIDHGSLPLLISDPICKDAETKIKQFLEKNEVQESFVFHAEFFVTSSGLSFCEMAARPAGGRIRESILETTGWFDILKSHVLLQAGCFDFSKIPRVPSQNISRTGWFVCPPRKGTLSKIDASGLPGNCSNFRTQYKSGSRLEIALHSGDELFSLLFKVTPSDSLGGVVSSIRKWASEHVEIDEGKSES